MSEQVIKRFTVQLDCDSFRIYPEASKNPRNED
jgi:hypothetical protein